MRNLSKPTLIFNQKTSILTLENDQKFKKDLLFLTKNLRRKFFYEKIHRLRAEPMGA